MQKSNLNDVIQKCVPVGKDDLVWRAPFNGPQFRKFQAGGPRYTRRGNKSIPIVVSKRTQRKAQRNIDNIFTAATSVILSPFGCVSVNRNSSRADSDQSATLFTRN